MELNGSVGSRAERNPREEGRGVSLETVRKGRRGSGRQVIRIRGVQPLEKGMATHSSVLAWRPTDRGAWWATVHGVARVRHN